jgi:hypothetical protein
LRAEKVAAVNAHIVVKAEQVSMYVRSRKVAVRWDEVSGSGIKTFGACTGAYGNQACMVENF